MTGPIERLKPTLACEPGSSRTKQSFKDECDINILTSRWLAGVPMPPATKSPQYGDFSSRGTYIEAVNNLNAANEQFSMLPSRIRGRFDNDPGQLIEFLGDPENQEEAIELGLADAPPEEPEEPAQQPLPATPVPVPGQGGIVGGESPPQTETPT